MAMQEVNDRPAIVRWFAIWAVDVDGKIGVQGFAVKGGIGKGSGRAGGGCRNEGHHGQCQQFDAHAHLKPSRYVAAVSKFVYEFKQ